MNTRILFIHYQHVLTGIQRYPQAVPQQQHYRTSLLKQQGRPGYSHGKDRP